jgi:molybdenum cofactor biosynthesis protein B
VQSRACGGLAKGTLIFRVPGSPGACEDAWQSQLGNRCRPCSVIALMPRLAESKKKKVR